MSEKLEPCPFCGGPAVNVAGEYATCGVPANDCPGHQLKADFAAWNALATPADVVAAPREAEEVGAEEIDEILRAFHYETFRAGICYDRDDWPTTKEEWQVVDYRIDSVAVGEHYEGWAPEMIGKLRRLFGPVSAPVSAPARDEVRALLSEHAFHCETEGGEPFMAVDLERAVEVLAALRDTAK